MLREWRRCCVWRWPWCGSFTKIMTGVIFWRMSNTAKTFVTSCSLCVFFKRPSLKSNTFFSFTTGQANSQGALQMWRDRAPLQLPALLSGETEEDNPPAWDRSTPPGGVERKCLISEVSQNIPKTKMAMKNPPWMKMYFLIFHWHFFVFRGVLKNKKTNDALFFCGWSSRISRFCRTDIVTCKTHRSQKLWPPWRRRGWIVWIGKMIPYPQN